MRKNSIIWSIFINSDAFSPLFGAFMSDSPPKTQNSQISNSATASPSNPTLQSRIRPRELHLPSHSALSKQNILFHKSEHFIIYGSLTGIKVLNTVTNTLNHQYGIEESVRLLHIALYQGAPLKKSLTMVEIAASSNPPLEEAEARDPMLIATGHHQGRFYIYVYE
ncbi:Peptidyl-prolyl cis-trans isomerase cyp15 [Rhizina undulata]